MKKFARYFSLVVLALWCVPLLASAQVPGSDGRPIVPCGTKGKPDCEVCHLYVLAKNIIDFLLFVIVPLAGLGIAVGGGYYILAGSNPSNASKGKSIIWSSVIGIVIAFGAWLIISSLLSLVANNNFSAVANWNQFPNCPQ